MNLIFPYIVHYNVIYGCKIQKIDIEKVIYTFTKSGTCKKPCEIQICIRNSSRIYEF